MPRPMDDFLFAIVGEDRNGMGLTVVSALARLGIDPWVEARRLAELSRPAAAHRLAPMIDRVPGGTWLPTDAQAIAERLVALLPDPQLLAVPVRAAAAEHEIAVDDTEAAAPRAGTTGWLIVLVLLSALLLAMTTRRDLSPTRLLFGAVGTVAAAGPTG